MTQRKRSFETVFLIFLAAVLAWISQFPIKSWLVGQRFDDDFFVIGYLDHGLYSLGIHDIALLNKEVKFDCGQQDVELLRETMARNPLIRFIDLHLKDFRSCSYFNPDISTERLVDIPGTQQVNFDGIALLLRENTIREIRFETLEGVIRLIPDPRQVLLPGCDRCMYILQSIDDRDVQIFPNNAEEDYELVYSKEIDTGSVIRFYMNERGLNYVVGNEVKLISLGIFLLLVIGILTRLAVSKKKHRLDLILKQAIEDNALIPFYQPIVEAEQNGNVRMRGCEVLVRWIVSNGDMMPPSVFIPLAEQKGLINPLTDQLLESVLVELSGITMPNNFFVSINVSPTYLEQPEIASGIIDQIKESNFLGEHLALEITERTPFSDLKAAQRNIERLREFGISIKLDDCGTGYGAFSYLHELDIDTIKIDRMFVKAIGRTSQNTTVLKSIIAFAQSAGCKVIAEGVETKEQVDFLIENGVTLLQGAYFAKPEPIEIFIRRLRNLNL